VPGNDATAFADRPELHLADDVVNDCKTARSRSDSTSIRRLRQPLDRSGGALHLGFSAFRTELALRAIGLPHSACRFCLGTGVPARGHRSTAARKLISYASIIAAQWPRPRLDPRPSDGAAAFISGAMDGLRHLYW